MEIDEIIAAVNEKLSEQIKTNMQLQKISIEKLTEIVHQNFVLAEQDDIREAIETSINSLTIAIVDALACDLEVQMCPK